MLWDGVQEGDAVMLADSDCRAEARRGKRRQQVEGKAGEPTALLDGPLQLTRRPNNRNAAARDVLARVPSSTRLPAAVHAPTRVWESSSLRR